MTLYGKSVPTRAELANMSGILTVKRTPQATPPPAPGQPGNETTFVPELPELFIAILQDNQILAFNGHVDLGTGIRTSLRQIVAEELNVAPDQLTMILGDPNDVPNQGPTIASATIQISAKPLRQAAAQAMQKLTELAQRHFCCEPGKLTIEEGRFRVPGEPMITYGQLLGGRRIDLDLDENSKCKNPAAYTVVGKSTSRVDLVAKARGLPVYVHDVRIPKMLHGRVIRPPYTGKDSGSFVGNSLMRVHPESIRHLNGFVDILVEHDFVGVVAEREEDAVKAAKQLKIEWKTESDNTNLKDLKPCLEEIPATKRELKVAGDLEKALKDAKHTIKRSYLWPYQLHGSIGPSCSVVDYNPNGRVTVWSGTQNPHKLRTDLSNLLEISEENIEIIRMEASGCYGRNCADDVCGDAALLSKSVGAPVRVQLSRQQESGWEPKGTGQIMTVTAALGKNNGLLGYQFTTRYPSNDAPLLASILTGKLDASNRVFEMGDRTAIPPYEYQNMDIACDDCAPIVRSSWLRGVSALPNTFAHESMIDELAFLAGIDPLEYRLRHLKNDRMKALLARLAEVTKWDSSKRRRKKETAEGILRGRGIAIAEYVHSRFPGFGAAMAAWVVDLTVDSTTGSLNIEHIYVAQDAGLMINPDGVKHQVHGNIIQTLSRTLKESVNFEMSRSSSLDWGGYPIIKFPEIPNITIELINRPTEPPLGVGESASLPCAPAVANAIFDAVGVRLTQIPFTSDRILREITQLNKNLLD